MGSASGPTTGKPGDSEPRAGGRATRAPGPLAAALILAAFQALLFLPHLTQERLLLPASARLTPPWSGTGPLPDVPQDMAGTDKLVFTLPNLVRWRRAVQEDPRRLLWNPDILCGYPFLATQDTFALYPLNVLYLIWEPVEGFLWSALLHGWLACMLAWLALRTLGASPWGAVLGGAVYGGSAWFLAHLDVVNFGQAAAWIPLMVTGTVLAARKRRLTGVAALAAGAAMSFLGGMAQVTLIGLLLCGLVALGAALGPRAGAPRARGAGLGLALAGVLLGLALAAPQLLPTADLAAASSRLELTRDEVREAAVRPVELSGLLFPELLGNPAELDRWHRLEDRFPEGVTEHGFPLARAAGLPAKGASFMERAVAPGAAALLLLVAGLLLGRCASPWLAAGLVVLGLAASMPGPFQDLARSVPGFAFGNARRLLLLALCGLAAGAAWGFDALMAARPRKGVLLVGGLLLLPGVALAALAWTAPAQALELLGVSLEGASRPELQDAWIPALGDWIAAKTLPPLLALVGAAVVLAALPGRRALVAPALLVLLGGEMLLLNHRCNPGQPEEAAPGPTPLVTWLAEHPPAEGGRLVRFLDPERAGPALPPLPPNLGLLFGLRDLQGYEGLVARRTEELLGCIEPGLVVDHHLVRELRDPRSLEAPLLDVLGVGHVLAVQPLPLPLAHGDKSSGVGVFRRPGVRSRLVVPRRIEVLAGASEVLERLRGPGPPDSGTCLLEPDAARRLGLDPGGPPREQDPEEVSLKLLDATATCIRWSWESPRPVVVRLADAYHPGWSARVEGGEEVAVAPADHALRALRLPAGRGNVVMEFTAPGFRLGLWAAFAALAVLLAALWLRLIRRRRSAHATR